jgi:mitochondrial cardiolipin hydrolase
MPNLEELFRQTFDDRILSRQERRALAKILQEEDLDERELGALRAKVFDFAADQTDSHDHQVTLGWLYQASKLLLPKDGPAYTREVHFSPGDDCLHAIQQHLRQARSSADICVFTISDNRISEEIKACHRRGVAVRIITDNDKMDDRGSDIYHLARQGLDIRIDRTRYHMHHKFAVVDRTYALTGSYNWTRSAAEYNEENLLVSNDPEISLAYQRKFDQMWPQMEAL